MSQVGAVDCAIPMLAYAATSISARQRPKQPPYSHTLSRIAPKVISTCPECLSHNPSDWAGRTLQRCPRQRGLQFAANQTAVCFRWRWLYLVLCSEASKKDDALIRRAPDHTQCGDGRCCDSKKVLVPSASRRRSTFPRRARRPPAPKPSECRGPPNGFGVPKAARGSLWVFLCNLWPRYITLWH